MITHTLQSNAFAMMTDPYLLSLVIHPNRSDGLQLILTHDHVIATQG
jgi:hypothetical protein